MIAHVPADVISRLKSVLGPQGWSEDPDKLGPKLVEWRGRWSGETPLLVLPGSVEDVSAVVGVCADAGVAITPQGGNTGLVGGQIPQGEVLLSLERMRGVRDVNPLDDAIEVEAGLTLTGLHQAAEAAGRFFPLSVASEGSATVGGLISTNAGGTAVLRYGVMRDLVLGLEAVLPNGEVFRGLKRLRKDNTGYDLKQLLIGAEGTLGVVTAASLKLFPILASRATAMVGVHDPHQAVELLARAKAASGGQVEAFEIIARRGVEFALRHVGGRNPLESSPEWYVLIEIASGEDGAAESALERILTEAFDLGLITDAAIAQSKTQAKDFWTLRENQSFAQKAEGAAWKHDVSVPVSQIADFIAETTTAVEQRFPGARVVAFGHVGDGNVHYDVVQPEGGDGTAFSAQRDEGSRVIHDIVASYNGSISAEHGLGAMKSAEALRYKAPLEVQTMRAIRRALDPKKIMNPRVLF